MKNPKKTKAATFAECERGGFWSKSGNTPRHVILPRIKQPYENNLFRM
jgi:hypothetical protein